MVSLEVIAILLSGISISASLFYYANVLQNANKTRQTQLFYGIYSQMNQPYFIDAWHTFLEADYETYDEYMKYYEDPEFKRKMMILGVYWEGLGVLVRENLVPVHLIAKFITNMTRTFWEKQEEMTLEYRVRFNVPRGFGEVEYLYNELLKYLEEYPEFAT